MELYGERGFEQTTVAEIAERAGLTERTFFRHFADKREVLFGGAAELEALLLEGVLAAPSDAAPIEVVATALRSIEPVFAGRHPFARQRQAIIDANPDLQERELIKLARLAAVIGAALRDRGTDEPDASLAAEAGIAVFRVGFEQWVGGPDRGPGLGQVMDGLFGALASVTSNARLPEAPAVASAAQRSGRLSGPARLASGPLQAPWEAAAGGAAELAAPAVRRLESSTSPASPAASESPAMM